MARNPYGVFPGGLIRTEDFNHIYERQRHSYDMFGQPYPTFGCNLDAFILRYEYSFRALENAVRDVMIQHYGLPADRVEVYAVADRSWPLLTIKYDRGDTALIQKVALGQHTAYGYGQYPEETSRTISEAINQLIRRVLTTPIEQPAKKKLDQIKFNLKDFKSWLEDEAEDEEFVNVFMEYFGEEIEDEEK